MTDPEPLTNWTNEELTEMSDHDLLMERDRLEKALNDWSKPQDEPWRLSAWEVLIRVTSEFERRYPLATDPLPDHPV